jgi:hypothetical protein
VFRFFMLYTTLYAGFGVASPFLPILFQRRGLRSEEIGLVLALSTAVRLVSGQAGAANFRYYEPRCARVQAIMDHVNPAQMTSSKESMN